MYRLCNASLHGLRNQRHVVSCRGTATPSRHHAITPSRLFTHQPAHDGALARRAFIKRAFETRLADGIDDFASRPGWGSTQSRQNLGREGFGYRAEQRATEVWPGFDEDVAHEAAVYALDSYMRSKFCPGDFSMDVQLLEEGWGSEQIFQLHDSQECILSEICGALGYTSQAGLGQHWGYTGSYANYCREKYARNMQDFKRFVTERQARRGPALRLRRTTSTRSST